MIVVVIGIGWFLVLVGIRIGIRIGVWSADREGAFRRGYIHGWYDGLNGAPQMDHERKARLFIDGTLGSVTQGFGPIPLSGLSTTVETEGENQ